MKKHDPETGSCVKGTLLPVPPYLMSLGVRACS
jgi:hypothetical protein